jgi:hypothetical protein
MLITAAPLATLGSDVVSNLEGIRVGNEKGSGVNNGIVIGSKTGIVIGSKTGIVIGSKKRGGSVVGNGIIEDVEHWGVGNGKAGGASLEPGTGASTEMNTWVGNGAPA